MLSISLLFFFSHIEIGFPFFCVALNGNKSPFYFFLVYSKIHEVIFLWLNFPRVSLCEAQNIQERLLYITHFLYWYLFVKKWLLLFFFKKLVWKFQSVHILSYINTSTWVFLRWLEKHLHIFFFLFRRYDIKIYQ